MAQCYQCGSGVELSDRFCMECGADYPARPPAAPARSQGAAAPVGAALPAQPLPPLAQVAPLAPPSLSPAPGAPPQPTLPTWLPAEAVPAALQPPASPADPGNGSNAPQAASVAQETADFPCPRCGASLPQGARFCGDCGERMPTASTSLSTLAASLPGPSPSTALPDPIPPLLAGPPPSSVAQSLQPVLPPFHAPAWAEQPAPDVAIPDETLTPLLTVADPHAAPINPTRWGQAAPIGAPISGRLPEPAASPAPPAPWPPAQPHGPAGFGPFQPPFDPVQRGGIPPFQAPPAGQGIPAPSPFLQSLAAIPPVTPRRKKRPLPRGQVITMIIAVIVTVSAAIGGLLALFLSH